MGRKRVELAGQRFGRLEVIAYSHTKGAAVYWLCQCDCGTRKAVATSPLARGGTKSCGCLRREVTAARSTKHGLMPRKGRSASYGSWSQMIARTTRPSHPRFADWGGRGITVCERWRSFPNFLADMGEKPPGSTIERRDNEIGYEPGNCYWASAAEQNRNKRSTKLTVAKVLEIRDLLDGGSLIAAISRETGIERHVAGAVATTIVALRSEPHA